MSHLIQGFNILYGEFISKLENIIPDPSKLSTYNNVRKVLQKTNVRAPMQLFMIQCHPFSSYIFKRDEDYFINQFDSVNDVDIINDNFSDKFGLNEYWKELDDSSKNAIWQYLDSLLQLGYKAHNIEWSENKVNTPFKTLAKID